MNIKKKNIRLKKQFVAIIPVIITVTVLSIFALVNKMSLSTSEVTVNENIADSNYITSEKESKKTLLTALDDAINNRKRENTIVYYAEKYHISSEKAVQIAKELTNDFSSEQYLNTLIIGPQSVIDAEGSFKNEEAGIVYYVRDLSRYPEKYNITSDELVTSNITDTEKNIVDGVIYLKNGLTYEQFLGHICDLYGMNKEIVLAISYLESGYMKSFLATNKNNFGGQRSSSGWLEYQTPEAGIIGHVMTIRSLVEGYQIDLDSPTGISDLSSVYVNGHPGNPSESWTSKVTFIKNQNENKNIFLDN